MKSCSKVVVRPPQWTGVNSNSLVFVKRAIAVPKFPRSIILLELTVNHPVKALFTAADFLILHGCKLDNVRFLFVPQMLKFVEQFRITYCV